MARRLGRDPGKGWGGSALDSRFFPRVGQKFGRIIDHEPPNSRRWTEAVREAESDRYGMRASGEANGG
jgi:hypothetical protein